MRPDGWRRDAAIGAPTPPDWDVFLGWAAAEGWRVPEREVALYRRELAGSAFVLRAADGSPLGFATVCRQQASAWIGNLIVAPARRGEGLGRRLFEHAAGLLAEQGVAALWLTASPAGLPLYAACGFRAAGRIGRWVWPGGAGLPDRSVAAADGTLAALVRADAAAWGHSRAGLLTLLARGGQVFAAGGSVALLQPGPGLRVLGPWLSADHCQQAGREILTRVLLSARDGGEIAVDVRGDSPLRMLLSAAGFRQTGETVLMLRGDSGKIRFDTVVALASLGSMG